MNQGVDIAYVLGILIAEHWGEGGRRGGACHEPMRSFLTVSPPLPSSPLPLRTGPNQPPLQGQLSPQAARALL